MAVCKRFPHAGFRSTAEYSLPLHKHPEPRIALLARRPSPGGARQSLPNQKDAAEHPVKEHHNFTA
jgi:hypothetical protein